MQKPNILTRPTNTYIISTSTTNYIQIVTTKTTKYNKWLTEKDYNMADTNKKLKIGMTECGCDPGIDMSWRTKFEIADGAILITKHITDKFINTVIEDNKRKPITIHASTTGWGGTIVEPNVPEYTIQLNQIVKLINAGFPADRIVLRIDPIIPSKGGFERVKNVLDGAIERNLLPGMRVRISIMDNYPHVIKRFKEHNIIPMYNGARQAPDELFQQLKEILEPYGKIGIIFETCAEPKLINTNYIEQTGCLSNIDLEKMGLPLYTETNKCTQRADCLCLPLKFQLILNRTPCPHKCLYCYWQDKK